MKTQKKPCPNCGKTSRCRCKDSEKAMAAAMKIKEKNARHTPGPWDYDGEYLRSRAGEVGALNSRPVKILAKFEDYDEWEQDVALCAAAPDLLEVCRYSLRVLEQKGLEPLVQEELRHAIAKAAAKP